MFEMTGKTAVEDQKVPLLLSAKNLANCLNCSLRHVRRMLSSGKIGPKPIHIAGVKFLRSEIMDWLQSGAPDRRTWETIKGKHKD